MSTRTLAVLVENKPGVLARVSGLFSRRGFNIESLAVGPTERDELSRMTIRVRVGGAELEQVTKQLHKLVNVLKITELPETATIQRELLLVRVHADVASRREVLQVVEIFGAKVVDVTAASVTVELSGRPEKLHALLDLLRPFGIEEMVQSGVVALARDPRRTVSRIPHHATRKRVLHP